MTGGEFAGRQLAVGSIRGVRSFNVDLDGLLRGVTYTAVWQPGENTAHCMTPSPTMTFASVQQALAGGPIATDSDPNANLLRMRHGLDACTHGFYAYYDGSNDFGRFDRITAVIEGYGETLIGSRGFRCMKARILALHLPPGRDVTDAPTRTITLPRPTSRPARFRFALWLYGITALVDAVVAVLAYATGDWVRGLVYTAAAGLMAVLWRLERRRPATRWTSTTVTVPRFHPGGVVRSVLPAEVLAKVRANYPDVPVFDSVEAMLAAFPPDRQYAEATS